MITQDDLAFIRSVQPHKKLAGSAVIPVLFIAAERRSQLAELGLKLCTLELPCLGPTAHLLFDEGKPGNANG